MKTFETICWFVSAKSFESLPSHSILFPYLVNNIPTLAKYQDRAMLRNNPSGYLVSVQERAAANCPFFATRFWENQSGKPQGFGDRVPYLCAFA